MDYQHHRPCTSNVSQTLQSLNRDQIVIRSADLVHRKLQGMKAVTAWFNHLVPCTLLACNSQSQFLFAMKAKYVTNLQATHLLDFLDHHTDAAKLYLSAHLMLLAWVHFTWRHLYAMHPNQSLPKFNPQAPLTGDRNPLNTYTAAQQPGTEAPAQTATASVQVKFLSSDRVSLGPATRTFLHTTSGPLNVAAAGPTWSQMQRQPRSRKIGSDKRQCTEPECNIRPSFNFEGIRKGLYCSFHRKDGMVNVTDLRCLENGCRVVPKFNAPGSSKGLYCGAHKLEGMVLLYSTLCENQGCKVTAAFNLPGERSRRFCATHRLEGMIDVQGKRCENPACERFPLFNVAGVRGGRFCSSHRLEGMVKRVTTKCEHLACTISPLFNQLGLQGGRFCSSHKLEGMVNVVTKRCEESGCVKCASHKCEGEKGKRFCTEHARVGMVGPNKKKVM